MREKIIRDPVHDLITFDMDRPIEALLFRLLNAAEFQRLRRIRQLGLASLAYPGADHSRYSHSLGTTETARKMLRRLSAFTQVDEEGQTVCLVACLLHDLGHGPFSHVFERISGIHHEEMSRRLILDEATEVHGLLRDHDSELPRRIVEFMECRPERGVLNDVLSSQLDADRFDYLLRDNLMTGSGYGGFDLAWMLQAITVAPSVNRLAITPKGISAAEDYLQARYHMFRNVYFHKVVRSAEGMLRLALQRARRLAVQDRLVWPPREHAVHKALLGQALSSREFVELDDVSMLHCFKLWAEGEDQTLARLSAGLLYRRLFKVIDLSRLEDAEAERAAGAAAEAIVRGGGDADYEMFLDQPGNTSYTPLDADAGGFCPDGGIVLLEDNGQVQDFARTSPIISALNRQLRFRRLHLLEDWRDLVSGIVTR